MHSMSRYIHILPVQVYQSEDTNHTHTHTTATFNDPLSADFINTHAHERSLREVNMIVSK